MRAPKEWTLHSPDRRKKSGDTTSAPAEVGGPDAPTHVLGAVLVPDSQLVANAYIGLMNKTLLPEQIAKLERKCLATEDGAKAIQEVAERSVAVREKLPSAKT